MTLLIAALVAPALGPLIYGIFHAENRTVRIIDGFVYFAVPALVAWQVVPHAFTERSLLPVALVALGMVVPNLMERLSRAFEAHTDDAAMVVGLSGLALHTLLEGAAFAPGDEGIEVAFGLAVVLHRIPVGLVVWWLVRPRHGPRAAAGAVALLILGTLAGYLVGTEFAGSMHGSIELYQAFVSGSLIHVVFHQGRHDHDHGHDHSQGHDHDHRPGAEPGHGDSHPHS